MAINVHQKAVVDVKFKEETVYSCFCLGCFLRFANPLIARSLCENAFSGTNERGSNEAIGCRQQ